MHPHALRLLACALASLGAACGWIHPTEPRAPLPAGVALPRFEEVPVDFAHRWDHETSHHLTGAAVLDLDGDADVDLVVARNDGLTLYRNEGGRFRAQPLAVAPPEHSVPLAVAAADIERDGDLRFTDVTTPATASKQNTFASVFVDLDGDRYQDLVVEQNTGQVEILRNTRDGGFAPVPFESGYGFWMGVAAGDVDGDGDQDLAFTNVATRSRPSR